MNLNECIVNPGNKRKSKKTFVITARENGCDQVAVREIPSTSCFSDKRKHIKKSSELSSSTKWGSECINVLNSTSSRRSSSSKITEENRPKIIVALTEGRGHAQCEVGIAVISISCHHLTICQISDSQNYINTLTKINILNPSDILFPSTFENSGGNRLIKKVKEKFPNIRYIGVQRSLFNKLNGFEMLSQLCIPSLNGVLLVLNHKYYALAAACALLTYIQDNLYIYYALGSLKIDYQESEGYTMIDVSTADRLELVCCTKPDQANKYSSLLGILNCCLTKIGTRKLRSWILQPPSNVRYIEERLNCVEELMQNSEVLSSVQVLLQKFSNVDALLNLATIIPDNPEKCSVRQLNYIINLNSIIELINPLSRVICNLKQDFFVKLKNTLEDPSFAEIKDMVRKLINDYAKPCKGQYLVQQRCFAVKPGVNELLDFVRKIYSERINDMKEYVELLSKKYNLALTLGNSQKKGYHMILTLNKSQRRTMKKSDLPNEFIEVVRSQTNFTMKTPKLVNISTRVDNIREEILKISNVIVFGMVVSIKEHIYLFHSLCEGVAQLDVYQSLAQTSLINHYTRPEFGGHTEVHFSQHPLLNFLLPSKPISNSILCSDKDNVHIITGPNGSGKSIYIRQVMLLQIMAQLGCFVPAKTALFKPVNRMFARIYMEDDMERNASSFVLEMKEIKYIMSTMTNDSLIIIDELCRSTSVEEGIALAIAIIERMALGTSYIFVTTHYKMLAKIHLMHPNIRAWQMETIPNGDDPKTFRLDYKYALIPGITDIDRYSVYILRNIWPKSIIKRIDDRLDVLEKTRPKHRIVPLDPTFPHTYEENFLPEYIKEVDRCDTDEYAEESLPELPVDQSEFNFPPKYAMPDYFKPVECVFNESPSSISFVAVDEHTYTSDQCVNPSHMFDVHPPTNFNTPIPLTSKNSNDYFDSSLMKMLSPVVSIKELDGDCLLSQLSLNQSHWSNFFTQEEYQSICHEFSKEFEEFDTLKPVLSGSIENANNFTYDSIPLSSLVSPDECQSICEKFSKEMDDLGENPPENVLNHTVINESSNTPQCHIFPVVTVKQGLNNTSLSFGEEDIDVKPKTNEKTSKKINIISNVTIERASDHDNVSDAPKGDACETFKHQHIEIENIWEKMTGNTVKNGNIDTLSEIISPIPPNYLNASLDMFVDDDILPSDANENYRTPTDLICKFSKRIIKDENEKMIDKNEDDIEKYHKSLTKPTLDEAKDQEKNSYELELRLSKNDADTKKISIKTRRTLKKSRKSKRRTNYVPKRRRTKQKTNKANRDVVKCDEDGALWRTLSKNETDFSESSKDSPCSLSEIKNKSSVRNETITVKTKNDHKNKTGKKCGKYETKTEEIARGNDQEKSSVATKTSITEEKTITQNAEEDVSKRIDCLKGRSPSKELSISTSTVSLNRNIDDNLTINGTETVSKVIEDQANIKNAAVKTATTFSRNNKDDPIDHRAELGTLTRYGSSAFGNFNVTGTEIVFIKTKTTDTSSNQANIKNAGLETITTFKRKNEDDLIDHHSVFGAELSTSSKNASSSFRNSTITSTDTISTRTKVTDTTSDQANIENAAVETITKFGREIKDGLIDPRSVLGAELNTSRSASSDSVNVYPNKNATLSKTAVDEVDTSDTFKMNKNNSNDTTSTNLSVASRNRKLDEASEFSTTEIDTNWSESKSKVSVSSASRKRNSDDISTKLSTDNPSKVKKINPTWLPTTPKKKYQETSDAVLENAQVSLANDSSPLASKKRNKDKYLQELPHPGPSSSRNFGTSSGEECKPKKYVKKRFVPPNKISARQIKKEFDEQNRMLMENNEDVNKFMEQMINRPSVKQLQNSTNLATIKKTSLGYRVISSEKRTRSKKRFPLKETFSNDVIDMSIFSDKHAFSYEEFMKSNDSNVRQLQFQPTFSFDQPLASKENKQLDSSSVNFSFTPDGYYKENKREIDAVVDKYLGAGASNIRTRESSPINIFENYNLSDEDFDL